MKINNNMLSESARAVSEAMVAHEERLCADQSPHEFSPEFEQKMAELCKQVDRPRRCSLCKCAAAILLALLLTGAAWLAVDTDARAGFIGWIKELFGREYTYDYTSDAPADTVTTEYELSWVPEGYTLLMVIGTPDNPLVFYQNEQGQRFQFSYISNPTAASWLVDIKESEIVDTLIHGFSAEIFLANDASSDNAIMWTEEDTAFYVAGKLSQSELIHIAENVTKK